MQLVPLFLYISSVFSYKILVFSPTYSRSHMISNGRYADELAKAGHDVVLFEPDWVHIFDHEDFKSAEIARRLIMKGFPNDILEVVSGFSTDVFADDSIYEISMIQLRYFKVQDRLCRQILDNDEIMNKLREEKFDAFFGEQVHLCGNGIAHALGIKSHFWIQSCPVYEYTNWWLGQPTPLSYIPAHGIDVDPNLGYIQRAHSVFYGAVNFLVGWYVHTGTTNMFREKYGPDFPHVGHIASDSDIVFVSTDEFIDMPRPILPNMINVGGLGVQETSNKPLGEEFEEEMQKGKKGVIYFSVGTIANTTKLPEIIGAVVTLAKNFPDYHIIAKAQPGDVHSKKIADSVPNLSVHFWIPQVAVLLHPRLKLFITHAGYNGIMEAARAGVPLVTMPFMFDQAKNSRTVQMSGWGIHVPRQSIKYDHQKIVTAVKEILENDKFKKNALRIQKLIQEKPFNASERLVKTVEFVLNNGGVKELLTADKMSGFDLLSLNPTFLEMVINKLDEKSYFRLQQTNKIMNEFIHNNKNICVHLPESYDFDKMYFKNEERERRCDEMDLECLYRVHFAELRPLYNFFRVNPEKYKSNCDLLKKYHITCEKLDLTLPYRPSAEKIMMLVNVVQPRIANGVYPWEDGAVRCKALLQSSSKALKEVHVMLNLENTATLVPQLFSAFSTVHITSRIYSTEEQVELLHTMLEILRSQSFPKLENFSLWSYPPDEFPSSFAIEFDEVKEKFKDLNWIYEKECKYEDDDDELYVEEKFIAILELSNGPCKVVWENTNKMSGFDLLSLNPTLLEMVINKLEDTSYFHLQQTCKVMNEFIHSNKNICVHLPDYYDFDWVYFNDEEKGTGEINVECLYSVRLAKLGPFTNFFNDNPEKYKRNCDILKKCRITCEILEINEYVDLSTEQIAMLINIVKPNIVSVITDDYRDNDADRCKALFQSKTLKEVHVSLDLENTATFVPQLFSTFPSVHINSQMYDTREQVKLLHTMLKILRSQSFPNLQNFSLWSYPDGDFSFYLAIDFDEVKEEFNDLNWIYKRKCADDDDGKDQMEKEFEDVIGNCKEKDEEKNEKEENEEIEDKEEDGCEIDMEEVTTDDEEEDDDFEDDTVPYAVETLTAFLELPNGPCKIVWENDTEFTRSHLSISLGDRERACFLF